LRVNFAINTPKTSGANFSICVAFMRYNLNSPLRVYEHSRAVSPKPTNKNRRTSSSVISSITARATANSR